MKGYVGLSPMWLFMQHQLLAVFQNGIWDSLKGEASLTEELYDIISCTVSKDEKLT